MSKMETDLYKQYEEEFINWLVSNNYNIVKDKDRRVILLWRRFISKRENLSTKSFECNIHTIDWVEGKSDAYCNAEMESCELCKKEDNDRNLRIKEKNHLINTKYGLFEWSEESYKEYMNLVSKYILGNLIKIDLL